jgi:hypothetical protein
MTSAKNRIKGIIFNASRVAGVERQSVLLGDIRAEQIKQKGKLDCLADAEFSVFSQWGEDGILAWLVDLVKPDHRRFVEFGIEDYRESNTRHLLMSKNWSGLVIDGSDENILALRRDAISYKHDLTSVCSFVTKENINQLIIEGGFEGPLGILSVDIDGVDYWVLEQIKNEADIVVVEYNDLLGPSAVSVPYDPKFVRLEKHWSGMYWGASLAAFDFLLKRRNMHFVGTNRAGTNAFYVHDRHVKKVSSMLATTKAWPCVMREVRLQNGSLAFKTYAESAELIVGMPLIEVTSGAELRFGQASKVSS